MKETYYFSHDFNARNDPKLQKVLMKLGHEGKGIFWDLIEILYENSGYLLLSQCDSYAFALRTDKNIISSLINDFDLFKNDGNKFWSESALNRINQRNDKSLKARESANKRWNNANAMRTQCDGNAIKERKGKENKEKEIDKEDIQIEHFHLKLLKSEYQNLIIAFDKRKVDDIIFKIQSYSKEYLKKYSSFNKLIQVWIKSNNSTEPKKTYKAGDKLPDGRTVLAM